MKVFEIKEFKTAKKNIKALKILIDQYITNGKTEAIKKIKKEQTTDS